MEKVVSYFYDRELNLIYVPHRHESEVKLRAISELPGVEVEKFTYPAEFEFLKRGIRPVHVASFFSTCLFHFQKFSSH